MGHAQHLAPQSRRALRVSAALTGVYFVVELVAGIAIGSVAVLSDAFHTASAVGGVLIAMGGDAAGFTRMHPPPKLNSTAATTAAESAGETATNKVPSCGSG